MSEHTFPFCSVCIAEWLMKGGLILKKQHGEGGGGISPISFAVSVLARHRVVNPLTHFTER